MRSGALSWSPKIEEWTGGRLGGPLEDPFDDFIGLQVLAFWRLIS
ncbi:hypothetical protein [Streptomyces sp. NPDC056105]